MTRRLFLTHAAGPPGVWLIARLARAGRTAVAHRAAPVNGPGPVARAGGFVDYEGWVVPVDDRNALVAARSRHV